MPTTPTNESGAEQTRLQEDREGRAAWKKWGPYLSERQWGTVREDYSPHGDAWNYFTHDQAQYRAYRWGEDGLAGISDNRQLLCFALALWNGRDPILKERLFGLTNGEGNHGEDVKEYYFYLDSTPTHSYMKYLYKYPQAEYPYVPIIEANRGRDKQAPEFELLDTGIFDEDRYFDVFVEYAKVEPEDVLIQITACNRGPEPADLHVLPTLWFRNTWSWGRKDDKPELKVLAAGPDARAVAARHRLLGERLLYCEGAVDLLFTENETNTERAFKQPNRHPYCKDGIIQAVVRGNKNAVNPELRGTKASAHYRLSVPAKGSRTVRLRLTDQPPDRLRAAFGEEFEASLKARRAEADAFYQGITPETLSEDEARVMRQALAGMLWSKQYFYYDLAEWLREHGDKPEEGARAHVRNMDWFHMYNADVIAARTGGRSVPQVLLREAVTELHLVGEPQGFGRQQRLLGRLPRSGQHRGLRPQQPAADGRLPGAIGRHRLDGVLCVGDAPDFGRARDGGRPPLRGHGAEVLRALPLDRGGDGQPELHGGQALGP
jgi:hypothetical protein